MYGDLKVGSKKLEVGSFFRIQLKIQTYQIKIVKVVITYNLQLEVW